MAQNPISIHEEQFGKCWYIIQIIQKADNFCLVIFNFNKSHLKIKNRNYQLNNNCMVQDYLIIIQLVFLILIFHKKIIVLKNKLNILLLNSTNTWIINQQLFIYYKISVVYIQLCNTILYYIKYFSIFLRHVI